MPFRDSCSRCSSSCCSPAVRSGRSSRCAGSPPRIGRSSPGRQRILDYFWHIVLPLIAMSLSAFATLTFLTKNSFLEEIRKQYVTHRADEGPDRAARALRACIPQRHADHHCRISRRLHRRLLRRFAADRDDLLARRSRPPRLRIDRQSRLSRWCSPMSTSSR